MKIKFLIVLSLAALLLSGACGGDDKKANTANVNTVNMNANRAVNMATPIPQTNESGMTDPALKSKIEAALKAKGFNDVTVDTTTTPATLRGNYPKDRLPELMQTAMEANGGKPVKNEASPK